MIYRSIIRAMSGNGEGLLSILLVCALVFAAIMVLIGLLWLADQFISEVVWTLLRGRSERTKVWVWMAVWVPIWFPLLLLPVPILAVFGVLVVGRRRWILRETKSKVPQGGGEICTFCDHGTAKRYAAKRYAVTVQLRERWARGPQPVCAPCHALLAEAGESGLYRRGTFETWYLGYDVGPFANNAAR